LDEIKSVALTRLDGAPAQLADQLGQVTVINLWATFCGPCLKELPFVQALADRYRGDETVRFLSICVDPLRSPEDLDAVKRVVQQVGLRVPLLLDKESRFFRIVNGRKPGDPLRSGVLFPVVIMDSDFRMLRESDIDTETPPPDWIALQRHYIDLALQGRIVEAQEEWKRRQEALTEPDPAADEPLQKVLLEMMEQDQGVRSDPGAERGAISVDDANVARLKEIIARVGWPRKRLVGWRGALAAWLVAQHADGDPVFQARCLDLLRRAAEEGEAAWKHVAYLTDRIRVGKGAKQLYGTQFQRRKGRLVPAPIEDPDHLDERRRTMGLKSFADYKMDVGATSDAL
jgi:thiol-disulfide isomerase/thioredoxin